MAARNLPKVEARVRFPSPAQIVVLGAHEGAWLLGCKHENIANS